MFFQKIIQNIVTNNFTKMFSGTQYNANLKNNLITSSESITSYVTGSSELLVPGRITASNNITQGSMSTAIEPGFLIGQPDIVQVSVGTNSVGTLEMDENSKQIWCKDIHWVRALRLSDDCHSYNIQLRLQPSQRVSNSFAKTCPFPKLILQTVRPIVAGQELLLWFSEDILAMLQIVFLSPVNIQGQKKYVCNRCYALYECPNPLKLHITLGCGKHTITYLWEKLSSLLSDSSIENVLKQEVFDFKLVPETSIINRQRNAIDLSTSNLKKTTSEILYRPYAEPSAFKPFKKVENKSLLTRLNITSPGWSIMLPHLNIQDQLQSVNITEEDDAQIETLVSSLGRSKQGHICLYCGKCYSRKYGLKIHIRTHTGYKPLECKYCSRPFGDPSNLNKHVRLHAEGNTPYKCDLCGKVLVRRRDLERHLKSRHMIETHPDLNIPPDLANTEAIQDDDDQKSQ